MFSRPGKFTTSQYLCFHEKKESYDNSSSKLILRAIRIANSL